MQDRSNDVTRGADTLDKWFAGLRLGEPNVDGALALIPIFADAGNQTVQYRTLARAIALGELIVMEAPQATVPTLRVINKGELPVLIIDGEEVVGGQQNRVVNTSLLVPAKSTFDLPVSCVEHGRWSEMKPSFDAGETAYPQLRSQKIEQVAASYARRGVPEADQGAVWDDVADRHRRVGSQSATGAMRDAYVARHDDLARAGERFQYPDGAPIGVIALVGGRSACSDIFDQPESLRAYWPGLVRSYALEGVGAHASRPSLGSARRLLERAQAARRTAFPSPGLGQDVRMSGNGIVGAALIWCDAAVHTAVFRRRHNETVGTPIRRSSQRAQ
jgi:hypothetical protein